MTGQEKLDQLINEGENRTQENIRVQEKIDALADDVEQMLAEYRTEVKIVDGLKVYNTLLEKQTENQREEIEAIQRSINDSALIERQILPLTMRMIDSLLTFISLDVPFLPTERRRRIQTLHALMERADVTVAEKLRRVFEAYDIESEYGRTVEAYKGTLDIDGSSREVEFLRVGRVALVYQTRDGRLTGYWDKRNNRWMKLSPKDYQRSVTSGLRIARKQLAPDLLTLPVQAPEIPAQ